MDEAAAAAIREDAAENQPRSGDPASEDTVGPSAEDTAEDTSDSKYPVVVTWLKANFVSTINTAPVGSVQAWWPLHQLLHRRDMRITLQCFVK